MEQLELKHCPFCGGNAVLEMDESWYWEYEIYCPKCGASNQSHFANKKEAIDFWNRRTIIPND